MRITKTKDGYVLAHLGKTTRVVVFEWEEKTYYQTKWERKTITTVTLEGMCHEWKSVISDKLEISLFGYEAHLKWDKREKVWVGKLFHAGSEFDKAKFISIDQLENWAKTRCHMEKKFAEIV